MKKLIIGSILISLSSVAAAQNFYGGIAYSMLDSDLSFGSASGSSEPTALNIIGGSSITENFSVEGLLGFGISDDNVGPLDAQFELSNLIGVFAVGTLPVADGFNVYGKIGFADLEFEDVDTDKASGDGLAYGFGAKMKISDALTGALEYVVYPDAEYDDVEIDIETSAIDLRLNFNF